MKDFGSMIDNEETSVIGAYFEIFSHWEISRYPGNVSVVAKISKYAPMTEIPSLSIMEPKYFIESIFGDII